MAEHIEVKISKKQQQIVETAEELFLRHGIKRVTVEEICRKAGVSKMTFYKYFANKMKLMQHIWDMWVDEAYKKLDEVEAMAIPFPEKLRLMQEYKLGKTAEMSTDCIEELLQIDFYIASAQQWGQRVIRFITDAQKRGDLRPEVRTEFILAIFGKLNELVEDKRLINLYPDYVEFTREIWNFFYYGLMNRVED